MQADRLCEKLGILRGNPGRRYAPPDEEGRVALDESGLISYEELELAFRNHGMPLEALDYPLTPVGLHYLLTHYDIPRVDAAAWRLEVSGLVERPLALSLDELRKRPSVELAVTMECAGNGRALLQPRPMSQPWLHGAVGTAGWRGVPLAELLEEAGIRGGEGEVVFTGLDHGAEGGVEQAYERSLTLDEALSAEAILAYGMNGQPLPPQHGFPLRLVVPGWYGMTSVKWLTRITVQREPFTGYQQTHSYRVRYEEDEEGTPLTRILPRSLIKPPGRPEFPSRRRELAPGRHALRGRAWSGWAPIAAVDVSTDAGATWSTAKVERDVDSRFAWCSWRYEWDAQPGEHELLSRARDEAGNVQPLQPEWNLGGYGNNAVQRVAVTVTR
jgi:DMSO/TMAO reductase YedYZ molybdopterin-dependent catalytic subunit